jgi:hypothetical protein
LVLGIHQKLQLGRHPHQVHLESFCFREDHGKLISSYFSCLHQAWCLQLYKYSGLTALHAPWNPDHGSNHAERNQLETVRPVH